MANYSYPYPPQFYPAQTNAFQTGMNVAPTPTPTQPTQAQIQNGGFVSVPTEEMVYSYPVAPGNCVTFKIEGKPIVMEKSMGFSQLESPKIKRFRLVEEEPEKPDEKEISDVEKLKSDIKEIWGKIDEIENTRKPTPKRADKNGED